MPFYEFHCKQCDNIFTIRATIKEKEAGLTPLCPQCQGQEIEQVITAGLVLRSQGQNIGLPACGPSAGPGCC